MRPRVGRRGPVLASPTVPPEARLRDPPTARLEREAEQAAVLRPPEDVRERIPERRKGAPAREPRSELGRWARLPESGLHGGELGPTSPGELTQQGTTRAQLVGEGSQLALREVFDGTHRGRPRLGQCSWDGGRGRGDRRGLGTTRHETAKSDGSK